MSIRKKLAIMGICSFWSAGLMFLFLWIYSQFCQVSYYTIPFLNFTVSRWWDIAFLPIFNVYILSWFLFFIPRLISGDLKINELINGLIVGFGIGAIVGLIVGAGSGLNTGFFVGSIVSFVIGFLIGVDIGLIVVLIVGFFMGIFVALSGGLVAGLASVFIAGLIVLFLFGFILALRWLIGVHKKFLDKF